MPLLAKPEEFRITIRPDGKIELDFRGMEISSYRRIVELLQETVGPLEAADTEAEEGTPPGVHRAKEKKADQADEQDLKQG